ncbi:MAG: phosphoribosylamine--glycine ligase [bacterium]|nr:MAG: phosphoribosylamine--glycine ligase [bacterium]
MKILIVGGGGREHAIAWKLAQSSRVEKIFCAPGNAGTAQTCTNVPISADDLNALIDFAVKEGVGLTVVGPEAPLVGGIVDLFNKNNLKIFGPSKDAAMLEGSKIFMKEILENAGIPTAMYKTFTSIKSALVYAKGVERWPQVIKADGLAAGKGVLVASDYEEAATWAEKMSQELFGDSGGKWIIEDFIHGEEASYIVVSDGENYAPLATSQDHKRALDGDKGPNTGGMGAYSPAPVITPEVEKKIKKKIIEPLLNEMRLRGMPFKGFLYAGLMISDGEPSVLEFNVRLGDPEAQPILCRYGGDLLDLLEASADGDVSGINPRWEDNAAVCIVMASGGYPGDYEKGHIIEGLNKKAEDVVVFHAGTRLEEGRVVTSGGRVLGVTATAPTIREAAEAAYSRAALIKWKDAFYRKDIAARAIRR